MRCGGSGYIHALILLYFWDHIKKLCISSNSDRKTIIKDTAEFLCVLAIPDKLTFFSPRKAS